MLLWFKSVITSLKSCYFIVENKLKKKCCFLPFCALSRQINWMKTKFHFKFAAIGLKCHSKYCWKFNSPQVCILSQNLYFDSKLNFISSSHFNQSCHLMVHGLPDISGWCNNVTNLDNNLNSGRPYFESKLNSMLKQISPVAFETRHYSILNQNKFP